MMRRALPALLAVQLAGCSLLIDVEGVRRTRDAGGAPVLVGDRTSLDFGSNPVGEASPPAVLRLSNIGTALAGTFSVTVTGAEVFGSPDVSGCQELAAGASCEVPIIFTPAAAQPYSSTLTVTASPGGSVSLLVTGTGVVAGALQLEPRAVDFGSVVQAGNSATLDFTVRNTGASPSGTINTRITGVDEVQFEVTADGCAGQALAADATCTISARFSPGTPGARRATLTVTAAPGGTAVSTLVGLGLTPGTLGLSPSSRTLASLPVGSQGTPVTFQVTNSGSAASGPLSLVLTGGGAPDFELVSTDCAGAVLAPTTSCSAQVRFAPRTPGAKVATLTASATPGGQASASLSATAQAAAALAATPPLYDYGTVLTTAQASVTVTVSNPGAVPSGVPTATLAGGDGGTDFSLGTNGCTAALAPGGSCEVEVRFAPQSDGPKAVTLVVSAVPGGAVSVPLSGTAVLPGALAVSPPSFGFGMVEQGAQSAVRAFTVSNTGGAPTTALTVLLSGTNADQFTLGLDACTGQVLAPLASCDVEARFTPSAGGSKSASLAVSATAGGTAVATLSGVGRLLAALSMTPPTAVLGSQVGGQPGMSATFDVVNTGDVGTTTPLLIALGGAQPQAFTLTANTCAAAPLAGGGQCSVTVQFTPGAGVTGAQSATLTAQPQSGPGGVVNATLSGTALSPSALGFDSQSFGATLIGSTVTRTFTLTNSGGATSGRIALSLGGGSASDFVVLSPTGGDCISGTTQLIGGASCTVQVRWTAGGRGARSSTLTAAASLGGSAMAALNGTGQLQATLASAVTDAGLGSVENTLTSAVFSWNVTNAGDLPSGVPTVAKSGANPAEFTASACTAPDGGTSALGPGEGCTVRVTMTPTTAGTREATLTVSASPGGAVALAASGAGLARLTVSKTGTGTVTSSAAGISCGATCTALFPLSVVTLTAATTNGSNSFFSGWSGGGCTGAANTCVVTADLSKTVTATFSPMTNNLAFVTSTPNIPHNLGALTNYDARCNTLATAAGINNSAGTAYRALIGNSTTRARSRFTAGVRGFVRHDGKPLFDLLTDPLAPTYKIYNALNLDEFGRDVGLVEVMTGVDPGDNFFLPQDVCDDWSINVDTLNKGAAFGWPFAGPGTWLFTNYEGCGQPTRLYCFMNVATVALTPAVSAGRKIWLSNTAHVPSSSVTPNAHCQAERAGGVATAKALISTTTVAASSALNATQTYVRPDGQVVGTAADLVAAGPLRSGIWQNPSGAYLAADAWTGYNGALTNLALPGTTCNDWTSSSGTLTGHSGQPYRVDTSWWAAIDNNGCDNPAQRLICVEQ